MKDRILMLVFVLVLGTILTTVLIAVDSVSTPVIRRNEALTLKTGILEALQIPHDAGNVEAVFAAQVKERTSGDLTYYVGPSGVAFQFEGSGLWGPIEGVIALEPDLQRLKDVEILHQEETPGLGSRVAEPEYLRGFRDKPFQPRLRLVGAGKGSASTDVEAISGATMTSGALVAILNDELSRFVPAIRQGGL